MDLNKDGKIGIIVFFICLILIYIIFFTHLLSTPPTKTYNVYVYWDNTNGLRTGSDVTMKGVYIGEVGQIDFSNDVQKAKVTLVIKGYHNIPYDSSFFILSGLIGKKWISVDPGSSKTFLSDGSKVSGITPISVGENYKTMNTRMSALLKNMDYIQEKTNKINDVVGDEKFQKNIKKKLIAIKKGSQQFNKAVAAADKHLTIFSENFQKGLMAMSMELAMAAKGIRSNIEFFIGRIDNSVNNMNKKTILKGQEIAMIVKELKKSSEELVASVGGIVDKLDPNTGIPYKIRVTLIALKQTCMFIEESAQEIMAYSEKTSQYQDDLKKILKNTNKAMDRIDGTLNSVLGYVKEEDKSSDFDYKNIYEIMITGGNEKVTADINADIYFSKEHDMLLRLGVADINTDYTTVNAQLGKVISPKFTVRGGLIKSAFGAGVDYTMADKLILSADFFDFSEHNSFIDLKSRYIIHKNFELVLGVDDVLEKRKLKVGFGLRF